MIRICDHFYKKEQYEISSQVAEKFLEKFPGQSHYFIRMGGAFH